jgi:hypothetical protein
MAGEKKLVKVYVEKIIEWEIFLAVDEDADVEEVALGLVNDDVIEESAEGDPHFKSLEAPSREEINDMVFLTEEGTEVAVVDHHYDAEGIKVGTVRIHTR